MIKILGPVFDIDYALKDDCVGCAPNDSDEFARLLAVKLSRCLLLDPEGVEALLFHTVRLMTTELQKAGISRLSGDESMSLSVLLPSICGFMNRDGKSESRFVILTKPALNKWGATIAGFAALNDVREILEKAAEKVKAHGN